MCSPALRWSQGRTSSSVRWRWAYQLHGQPVGGHGLLPQIRVGSTPTTPGRCRRRRQTSSMTGPSRRSPRLTMPSTSVALRVVPLQLHAAVAGGAWRHAAGEILRCSSTTVFWPNHWNGVMGLGHEAAHRHRHRRVLVVLAAPMLHAVAGQLGDAQGVLVGLRGQPGEEVQLHATPALGVGRFHRVVEVLLADELVDDLAHAPGAGLGGERQPGPPALLDLRTRCSTPKASTRSDGQRHRHPAARRRRPRSPPTTSAMPEKSAVDSDVRATSS